MASCDSLQTLPSIAEVIRMHSLQTRKGLGQHFLLDLSLTRRIAAAAGELKGQTVVEIGPGPGGLTRALLESDAQKVIAIERDSRCLDALKVLQDIAGDRLQLVEADALEMDIAALSKQPVTIVANLPYNISTPLLIHFLRQHAVIDKMTLMFQSEVVDRLKALPDTKAYGRLSVMAQWLCRVQKQFDVSPKAFAPPPKVSSTVVNLTFLEKPVCDVPFKAMEQVVKAAFGQRRKMLRTSLKAAFNNPREVLEKVGIDEKQRAENLSIGQFCQLAKIYTGSQNFTAPRAEI